jgi:choline dehydrogenase-like flavoprotein
MDRIVVVGSGPSGIHFALSVLRKGYDVTMIDVGYEKSNPVNPQDSFNALKSNLGDPAAYFLGENYDGILLPDPKKEYYGIPPNKDYVFRCPQGFQYQSKGFSPLLSFARGGLAEVWTGGCYPFNDDELKDFGFNYAEIQPHYSEVARRIGIAGVRDDLARFFPLHDHLLEPLELDRHSALLLAEYEKHKHYLNNRLRCFLGRTRIATLSQDQGDRKKCAYLGRCLWGCPSDSLYTPSLTLAQCREFPNFTYIPNMWVSHFKFTSGNRITSLVAEPADRGERLEFPVAKLVLAAGALSSSKIFLDSIFRNTGEVIQLHGLMDNRQILVPFVNLRLIGQPYNPDSYQYHQLGIGIEAENPKEYVHGQITTLKTAMLHPIIQNLPCDLKTAIFLVRNMHCALGIVNVNLHDIRRVGNYLTLEISKETAYTRLVINYSPTQVQKALIKRSLKSLKRALWRLGCVVPPGMVHIRPMGASAHYAGTLPMSSQRGPRTTSKYCQSHDFENLFIVDGTTFPFLPAKNITFTLMANAIRVAEAAF